MIHPKIWELFWHYLLALLEPLQGIDEQIEVKGVRMVKVVIVSSSQLMLLVV